MGRILYTISGTYAPFGVELRENNIGGEILRSEVKETAGSYELNNISDGTYVLVIYDNAGGVETSSTITLSGQQPTTTTTTTTTLAPNPPLFVAITTAGVTNTNTPYGNPANDLRIFITTDSAFTQEPDNSPFQSESFASQLSQPVTISLSIFGTNNGQRVTSVGGVNGSPQNVITSNSWNSSINQSGIILPVGFRYGFIEFGVRTTLTSPDDFTVIVSSSESVFGNAFSLSETENAATDDEYQLKGANTYGYTNITNNNVTIVKAVEDGGSEIF